MWHWLMHGAVLSIICGTKDTGQYWNQSQIHGGLHSDGLFVLLLKVVYMNIWLIIRRSKTYRILQTGMEFVGSSAIFRLLRDSRYLAGFLLLFVLLSIVRILLSDMTEVVKFLSFAVMFLVLAGFLRNIVRPSQLQPPSVEDGTCEDHE